MKVNSFFVFGLSCLFISGPGYSQDDNGNEKLNCNFAFFSGLFDAQFWAGSAQQKSPELTANY
ncbi:TPA: hypothetical protein OCF48_002456 [Escherichia coli]|nr:hypothetical protein [Escherichia coli]